MQQIINEFYNCDAESYEVRKKMFQLLIEAYNKLKEQYGVQQVEFNKKRVVEYKTEKGVIKKITCFKVEDNAFHFKCDKWLTWKTYRYLDSCIVTDKVMILYNIANALQKKLDFYEEECWGTAHMN